MKLILSVMIAAMFVIAAHAEDKAAPAPARSSWSDFLKNMKSTLAKSAVGGERKKGRSAQGVAAVRGDDQAKKNIADPNEPVLLGDIKSTKIKRERAYDDELEASIDQLAQGKLNEGLLGLEKFQSAHPKHRPEDVDKAIEGAKAIIAERSGAATPTAKE